jgi:hypothetical protein|tara:strand:- start:2919 stop:3056 length:138 start_codon:yes stop_codon:yes gene_type:complete
MSENLPEEEKVRFLFFRSWPGVYAFVLTVLAILIALFYFLTISYS